MQFRYTITGRKYQFAMDSLDLPLRWLRDQAIKKRSEDEGQEFRSDCPPCKIFHLSSWFIVILINRVCFVLTYTLCSFK